MNVGMIGNLIIFVLVSFMLLLFAGVGVLAAIGFFVSFHQQVRFLFTEYLSVFLGLGWVGIAVSLLLKAALSLGIIASSTIDIQTLNNSLIISILVVTISGGVGALIYRFRKYFT